MDKHLVDPKFFRYRAFSLLYVSLGDILLIWCHSLLFVYRGVKEIVVHEGYRPEQSDKYNDIALIKFDRPFFPETVTHAKIMPICLPPASTFEDEGKHGGDH